MNKLEEPGIAEQPSRESLDQEDLQRFIDANRIDATILRMRQHTPTVKDAALALDVETDQIVKSLIFLVEGIPLLVINNGLARVDRKKLADCLGIGRKRVKFARPEQALSVSGYVVGSMPPFGHRQKMRTLIDPAVADMRVIYAGGGRIDAMMRLTSEELLRVTDAELQDISETVR